MTAFQQMYKPPDGREFGLMNYRQSVTQAPFIGVDQKKE